jgi:hypothetical protein
MLKKPETSLKKNPASGTRPASAPAAVIVALPPQAKLPLIPPTSDPTINLPLASKLAAGAFTLNVAPPKNPSNPQGSIKLIGLFKP